MKLKSDSAGVDIGQASTKLTDRSWQCEEIMRTIFVVLGLRAPPMLQFNLLFDRVMVVTSFEPTLKGGDVSTTRFGRLILTTVVGFNARARLFTSTIERRLEHSSLQFLWSLFILVDRNTLWQSLGLWAYASQRHPPTSQSTYP